MKRATWRGVELLVDDKPFDVQGIEYHERGELVDVEVEARTTPPHSYTVEFTIARDAFDELTAMLNRAAARVSAWRAFRARSYLWLARRL